MPRFSLEKTVVADIEKVFDAATDFAGLQKAMPHRFPSVRVLSARGNVSVVEEHRVVAGKELVMMTKHVTDRPHAHEVFVIGGDAKGSRILERYSAVEGGTRVTVDADLKLRGAMRVAGVFGRDRIRGDFSRAVDELAALAGR